MSNLIGISGKIGMGKDTVGKIIQIFTIYPKMSTERVLVHMNREFPSPKYQIKKFADKLKDCVCLIIGCTREQLEDQEFKNTPLGPEWDRYITTSSYGAPDEMRAYSIGAFHETKQQMTPRLLLQLLGTDAGRNIIHPNIWVNASFANYKSIIGYAPGFYLSTCGKCGKEFTGDKRAVRCEECSVFYPNWIFTDVRFPNELEAIKSRGGITIRVTRTGIYTPKIEDLHESETALDNSNFDYSVDNNGSLSNLIDKVKRILELENII